MASLVWGVCLEEYVVPFNGVSFFQCCKNGCGMLLFCCLPPLFLCHLLMGLLCTTSVVVSMGGAVFNVIVLAVVIPAMVSLKIL